MTISAYDYGFAIELDVLDHPGRWVWPAAVALTRRRRRLVFSPFFAHPFVSFTHQLRQHHAHGLLTFHLPA